jgi:hypothetical protein
MMIIEATAQSDDANEVLIEYSIEPLNLGDGVFHRQ